MTVKSVSIIQSTLLSKGKAFGEVGPYEVLSGTVGLAVDPERGLNAGITDLKLASRGTDGRVHFDTDLLIMRPVEPARANRRLLFDVPNRGRCMALSSFNRGGADLQPGDGFLMRQGYTIACCGWQCDVPEQPGLMAMRAPEALENGAPVTGPIFCEFQPGQPTRVLPLGERGHRPYPANDLADPIARLSVRHHLEDPPRLIPRDQWQFGRLEDGQPAPSATSIYMEAGFEPGLLYELVYTAAGAPVLGAGLLAVRDVASWLRFGDAASGHPCAGAFDFSYGFGISQSGHFLRHFLYLGLNEDEQERQVFDGILPLIGSARRGEFNVRFGQPAKTLGQYVGTLFPFSDAVQTDPLTGQTDGLLARLTPRGKAPKMVVLDSGAEYWARQASLIHTDVEGTRDVEPPETTRIYHMTSTQHGSGAFPLRDTWMTNTRVRHPLNSLDYQPLTRAALVNLDRWVSEGVAPPPSRYPRVDAGTSATPKEVLADFGRFPGVHVPAHMPPLARLNFGPRTAEGILTQLPPLAGAPYRSLVSAVDEDGNEVAGVALPDVTVPLATYTGWNVRHPDSGAPDEWLLRSGATLPFPPTAEARQAAGDPRRAIAERYSSKADYLQRVREAATALIDARYVLAEDLERIVERARQKWEIFSEETPR